MWKRLDYEICNLFGSHTNTTNLSFVLQFIMSPATKIGN